MARIFLSHSSADNFEAIAVRDWLVAEGWDDVFLDIDPRGGIAAAERWERSLHEAANRCEAVIFLVSRKWLASEWCLREFNLAVRLNKRLFGVLIEDIPTAELRAEMAAWQVVNLAQGQDGVIRRAVMETGEEKHVTYSRAGLAKLKFGLQRAGLDPRFFEWPPRHDPDRPPYRGMKPLEAEDAGIFFGREAQVIEALDRLRGLADAAPPRFLAILGASGAGKSSFMRAGLLPRLERDDRSFLTLPVIRPEHAVMSGDNGFVASIEAAMKRAGGPRSRAEIKTGLAAGAEATATLLADLAEAARAPQLDTAERPAPPAIVIAIDQGEELFLAEGKAEAEQFLTLLASLLAVEAPRIIALATIRSDSYEALQTASQLEGIRQSTFSLPPLAKGAFQLVIEGPSVRLRDTNRPLRIEAALTSALLADVEADTSKDALPLLAFTLERLWREHGTTGDLRLADYRAMGGVRGSIEAAVERVMKAAETDADLRTVPDRFARLRRAIIPWLATIDQESKTPRRRVARLSEIPPEARPFIRLLVAERLLSTEQAFGATGAKAGDITIEPSHEALLRQWGQLQQWLDEEGEAYATIEGVKRAAAEWQAHGRDEAWIGHQAGRLEDAEDIARREDFGQLLAIAERDYLSAARVADNARRDRELKRQRQLTRRTRVGAAVAACLAVVAIGFAYYGFDRASEAEAQRLVAEDAAARAGQQAEIAEKARGEAAEAAAKAQQARVEADHAASQAKEAQAEAEKEKAEAEAKAEEARQNETLSLAALSRAATAEGQPVSAIKLALAAWPRRGDERPGLRKTSDSVARAFYDFRERLVLKGHADRLWSAAFSPDGGRIVTTSFDRTARIWNSSTGAPLVTLEGHQDTVTAAAFSPDGTRIVTASIDHTARIWDAAAGVLLKTLAHHEHVTSAAFSPDGTRIVTASGEEAIIWDAASGSRLLVLRKDKLNWWSAGFSPDGKRVAASSDQGPVQVWDATTGAAILTLKGHERFVRSVSFSPDGSRILTAGDDHTVRIWDTGTGAEISRLMGHQGPAWSASFSPDGGRILSTSEDRTVRLWNANGRPLMILKGHEEDIRSGAFSPDGNRVVSASMDGTARVWDVAMGTPLAALKGPKQVQINSVAYSHKGDRVVAALDDRTARIWDASSGAELAVLKGHDGEVTSAAFSADDSRVVTASHDGTVRVWDTESGAQLSDLKGGGSLEVAIFSSDGSRIAAVSSGQRMQVWDLATGAELFAFKDAWPDVGSVDFSPDGTRLISLWRNVVHIRNSSTGADLIQLTGHRATVTSASFSPDGTRIVTSSLDNTIRLWDAATGASLLVVSGGEDYLPTIATFSSDGTRILVASVLNLQVLDAATGAQLLLLWDTKVVVSATISRDGRRIFDATRGNEGVVGIWDISALEKGDAFQVACQRLGNDTDLSDVEARYGLSKLTPICGDHPPLPVDQAKLQ